VDGVLVAPPPSVRSIAGVSEADPIAPPLGTFALDAWEADELAGLPHTVDLRSARMGPAVALGIDQGKITGVILLDPRDARGIASGLRRAASEAGKIG
jgi:hypothetical protein